MFSAEEHGRRARKAYERPEYQTYLAAVSAETKRAVESALRARFSVHEASVTTRLKEPASFEEKASRLAEGGASARYLRPLTAIHDQIGVRVAVLHYGFLNDVRALIEVGGGLVVEHQEDKSFRHSERRSFGYGGIHLEVRPVDVDVEPPVDEDCGVLERVEIQVRTQVQHAWAEVEHHVRYKNDNVDEPTSRELDRAAALLEIADDILSRLAGASEPQAEVAMRAAESATPPEATTLPELLALRFPGARQPTPTALQWIARCVEAFGLGDVEQLDRALDGTPLDAIERAFREAGHADRSQARQLDDALLWLHREDYVAAAAASDGDAQAADAGRPGILRWRLDRMRQAGIL